MTRLREIVVVVITELGIGRITAWTREVFRLGRPRGHGRQPDRTILRRHFFFFFFFFSLVLVVCLFAKIRDNTFWFSGWNWKSSMKQTKIFSKTQREKERKRVKRALFWKLKVSFILRIRGGQASDFCKLCGRGVNKYFQQNIFLK